MEVNQYLFQSPSPQQVQIGKLDPNVAQKKNEQMQESNQRTLNDLQKVKEAATPNEENPLALRPERLLDTYA